MDTDDATDPLQETPSTLDDTADEKKADEEAPPSNKAKLPAAKAPDDGPSEEIVSKKDVKVKRDLSSAAVRPGAVAVPGVRLAAEAVVRQEFIATAVAAEVVDKSELEDTVRNRRCRIIAVLAIVVFIAAVVGGVVGSQSGGASEAGGVVDGGSEDLPTMAPSTSPSMSAFPSVAPTETPNNDFCDEALDVTGDDIVIVQSLQNTTVEISLTCSSGGETQRGRWYEYSGNGLGLTVEMQSAVEDETLLEIFTGTCQELECTEAVASSRSTVNFIATENTTYLIHVFSTLDAMAEPSADYRLQVSDNGGCANAYPINSNRAFFSGSTAAAVLTDIAPPCGGLASVGVAPGVWFEVVGDGMNIEASTCGGASFDTQISVYTGGCGSLECVTGNNDFCGTQSSVIWLTEVRLTFGCSL
jgi:hypothetical protein